MGIVPDPSSRGDLANVNARELAGQTILMTADVLGGVWVYALELIQGLRASEVNVSLATFGGRLQRHQWEAAARCSNLRVYESGHRLEWMEDPWEDLRKGGEWLLELEADLKPALAHLNQFCFASLPWKAPKLVVAHSDVLTWWRAVKAEAAPSHWNRYAEEVTRGLASADAVICPSAALLEAMRQVYGPLRPAHVIPNGRLLEVCPEELRKEPFVLGVGRVWDEAKNLQTLDAVSPSVPWPVLIAGPFAHPNGGAVKLRQASFLGELSPEQTVHWMRSASIYCLPARYEPFGLSILEAALCRCALVLGAIPSLRENWEGAAVFVDPDDAGELAKALNHLISDSQGREALGAKAAERARAFSRAHLASSYLNTYTQLLALA